MLELPLTANVCCTDGARGRLTRVVIHLRDERVTYLVVKLRGNSSIECLVPLKLVAKTAGELITLSCAAGELSKMMPFKQTEWIENAPGCYVPPLEQYLIPTAAMRPYCRPQMRSSVPPGEVAVKRGTPVETTKGQLGRVEKLLVHQRDGRIVRVAILTGRPWRQKLMLVSFWRIARLGNERVYPMQEIPAAEAAPVVAEVSVAGP